MHLTCEARHSFMVSPEVGLKVPKSSPLQFPRSRVGEYAFALLAVGVAAAARGLLDFQLADRVPYQFFVAAAAVVGLRCTLYPTVLSVVLGALAGDFLFSTPRFDLHETVVGWWMLVAYLVSGAIVVYVTQARQRGVRGLQRAGDELKRLAAIVESSEDAIISRDLNAVITSWNKGAERLFGYTAAEAIGQPIAITIPPDRLDEERTILDRLRRGETVEHFETVRRRKDGVLLDLSLTISPVRDEDGAIVGISKIARDITARKQTEETLRVERERLALALSAGRMGVYEADLVTGKRWWSPEVSAICGLDPEQLTPSREDFLALVHPDDRDAINRSFDDSIARHQPFAHEFRLVRSDGAVTWLACRGQNEYDRHGRPLRHFGVIFDTTERKRAEETLRESEKVAAAGRMASSVAHEINNPLASVVNLWYLLSTEPLPPQAREYLAMAGTQLDRIVHITRQSLAFYRDRKKPVPIDICGSLDRVLSMLRAETNLDSVAFRTEYQPRCLIHAYPDELLQLFSNVLRNAVEAGSSKVVIRAGAGHTWNGRRREGVRIIVADDGRGIERHRLNHLFEPFNTTKKAKGTGLGLWVSKGIVDKNEGHIAVRSSIRSGRCGTTVSIFLPSNVAATPPHSAGPQRATKSKAA